MSLSVQVNKKVVEMHATNAVPHAPTDNRSMSTAQCLRKHAMVRETF